MNLTYLYNDGEFWHFMNNETFEQLSADAKAIGDNAKWLLDQAECIVTLWNGQPISVTPPNFVELEIVDTDPGLKGDTAGTGGKPATLSTGAVVKVPLFVQIGEVIKVDTRSGEYVSREVMRLWCGLQAAPSLIQVRDDETPYRSCFACQHAAYGL